VNLTDDEEDGDSDNSSSNASPNEGEAPITAIHHSSDCPLASAVRQASLAYAHACAKRRFPTSISRLDIDEDALLESDGKQKQLTVCVCGHTGGRAASKAVKVPERQGSVAATTAVGGGIGSSAASSVNAESAPVPAFPYKTSPITDEYRITHEIIGIGESGKVMACFHRASNTKYALKVLKDGPRSRREVQLHYLTK